VGPFPPVFDNLQAGLQAVGAGFEQVVKLTYYLVVEVRRLVRDDLLIEVEAIAMIASFQPMTATA
jgi:enamine deaminase RidA (YjgF/YER057c/UK114 family)